MIDKAVKEVESSSNIVKEKMDIYVNVHTNLKVRKSEDGAIKSKGEVLKTMKANLRKPVKNNRYEFPYGLRTPSWNHLKIHNPGAYLKRKLYERRMEKARSISKSPKTTVRKKKKSIIFIFTYSRAPKVCDIPE